MSLRLAATIARRELRGGLSGFRIFLACLALGVAAIAGVGSVRMAIEQGLTQEGATILGGDAQLEFTYRFASDEELAWMDQVALDVSALADFRSMAVVGDERALTQVKAVDDIYPIYGTVSLSPDMDIATALAGRDGLPGGVMQGVLMDRLGLEPGDIFRLGTQDFVLMAELLREPDSAAAGFNFGPRTIVGLDALGTSGLVTPGTLFESEYRLRLPDEADLNTLEAEADTLFTETGMRWRDRRNGAPGVARFVDRLGSFLVLVGLAGLAVGGVGIAAAVRAYLERKTATIATLKTLGAEGRIIFQIYLMQIGLLTTLGIAIGLLLGAAIPLLIGPVIEARLPLPALFGVYAAPLAEAALYGVMAALLFTLWPLARARDIRAARLFRDGALGGGGAPRWPYLIAIGVLAALLVTTAAWLSGIWVLAVWSAAGIIAALCVLALAAQLTRLVTRRLARAARGRPALRLALGAVGGPGGETSSVILSLGLGLTVLATVGQIDSNLRNTIANDLPVDAPAYFFVDIQNDQLDGFLDIANGFDGTERIETAPMLRGVITGINGAPASEGRGDHWVLRGDRGLTYATEPTGTLTEGSWWAEDYTGPPLVSFATEEGIELGLSLGDTLTINVLGRDIEAEIANFRTVDFGTLGINFIMTLNPAALAGAPHTHIATVYADDTTEAPMLRALASAYPNITAIRVRDAIDRVTEAVGAIAAATSYGALATLITGFVVLIGAAAAGERRRVFEAAVLKTLGATRARILTSFALRSTILGGAAGVLAIIGGGLAGWGVMTFVMDAQYVFEPVSAIAIVLGGALASLIAGLLFALRPLAVRPARVLRAQD